MDRLRGFAPSDGRGGRLRTLLLGLPHHTFGSIDVTYKCNLRCTHCYFFAQETTDYNL